LPPRPGPTSPPGRDSRFAPMTPLGSDTPALPPIVDPPADRFGHPAPNSGGSVTPNPVLLEPRDAPPAVPWWERNLTGSETYPRDTHVRGPVGSDSSPTIDGPASPSFPSIPSAEPDVAGRTSADDSGGAASLRRDAPSLRRLAPPESSVRLRYPPLEPGRSGIGRLDTPPVPPGADDQPTSATRQPRHELWPANTR
jgi:hypothetical protein